LPELRLYVTPLHPACKTHTDTAPQDKLAETKGEDFFDREKAKHEAKRQAENMYDEHYVNGQGADQYNPNQYDRPGHFERRGW
jgi:hypothetical protein